MKLKLGQIIIRKHNMLGHFNKHVMCKWRIRIIFLQKLTGMQVSISTGEKRYPHRKRRWVPHRPCSRSLRCSAHPLPPAASALTESGGEERHGEERCRHDESGEWRAAPRQGE
jgi:hypothetical protein